MGRMLVTVMIDRQDDANAELAGSAVDEASRAGVQSIVDLLAR